MPTINYNWRSNELSNLTQIENGSAKSILIILKVTSAHIIRECSNTSGHLTLFIIYNDIPIKVTFKNIDLKRSIVACLNIRPATRYTMVTFGERLLITSCNNYIVVCPKD